MTVNVSPIYFVQSQSYPAVIALRNSIATSNAVGILGPKLNSDSKDCKLYLISARPYLMVCCVLYIHLSR